jgi:hypothetical protein
MARLVRLPDRLAGDGDGDGDEDDEQIPLCRIEYPGDDEDRGFAIYDPATETYTPALLRTGQPTGHPNDAFDTAAIIHLADLPAVTTTHLDNQ